METKKLKCQDCKKYVKCLTLHPISPLDTKQATHKSNWFLPAKLAFRSILKGCD